VAAIKQLIPLSAHAMIGEKIVDETARRIAAIRATPEAQEGMEAFLKKRKPAWAAPASEKKTKKLNAKDAKVRKVKANPEK
jgi:methylglutaconyl-CoA hydratase